MIDQIFTDLIIEELEVRIENVEQTLMNALRMDESFSPKDYWQKMSLKSQVTTIADMVKDLYRVFVFNDLPLIILSNEYDCQNNDLTGYPFRYPYSIPDYPRLLSFLSEKMADSVHYHLIRDSLFGTKNSLASSDEDRKKLLNLIEDLAWGQVSSKLEQIKEILERTIDKNNVDVRRWTIIKDSPEIEVEGLVMNLFYRFMSHPLSDTIAMIVIISDRDVSEVYSLKMEYKVTYMDFMESYSHEISIDGNTPYGGMPHLPIVNVHFMNDEQNHQYEKIVNEENGNIVINLLWDKIRQINHAAALAARKELT